jgi:hypothetical protein
MEMKSQTSGTWIVIAANCILALVGVLQGVDWLHLVGSSTSGWVVMLLAAANAAAHYFTGPDTPVSSK